MEPPAASSSAARVGGVDPGAVLSAEELELLRVRFTSFSEHSPRGRRKALTAAQAVKLFRDDHPALSEWEIHEMLRQCDLNFDGQLSIAEYLQARAYHRLAVEASTEHEVFRSFSILDTDGDGVIVADDVLALVERAGVRAVGLLKQAITLAASATKSAEHMHPRRHHRAGEITFEHFTHAIRLVNRSLEQDIAAKTLRLLSLQDELAPMDDSALAEAGAHTLRSPSRRAREKREVLAIEIDVLQTEIARAKRELLTDANNPLGRVCESLVATYDNEQHVYECLRNFVAYCCLRDPTQFRFKLERSGKEVHVLDAVLMAPPAHVKNTEEYARMTDLTLTSPSASAVVSTLLALHTTGGTQRGMSPRAGRDDLLLLNPTLRRQFVFYTTSASVTNLETMSRSGFIKFVHDCDLHALTSPPLTEAELVNVFAKACGTSKLMTFRQWTAAIQLLLERAYPDLAQCPTAETLEALVKSHVLARAKLIQTQNLAPDVSLTHVMKLLKEHIWQLKQIFFHFGVQSLVEIGSNVTVDMKEFLSFARAFGILRSTEQRDGEPYSPPPAPESAAIQPISLMELVREFYAAKLDVSFSDPRRRDAADLTFREFLRCILRISLAMHAHAPPKTGAHRANGIVSTTFEALKDDEGRAGERPNTPLYHRRGNVLGSSPTKACKMTSTSVISKLLRTSRALVRLRESNGAAPNNAKDDCFDVSSTRPSVPHKARPRPVTSGGPPVVRVIRAPDT
ncbi:hypothetical protein PybrP1_012726 [[Pythium] brassicae (nom. inval.)]|nr:hypothetical protein PybrP1_012726 [[Pythium] brassicae (nom. inval.)]